MCKAYKLSKFESWVIKIQQKTIQKEIEITNSNYTRETSKSRDVKKRQKDQSIGYTFNQYTIVYIGLYTSSKSNLNFHTRQKITKTSMIMFLTDYNLTKTNMPAFSYQ